MMSNKSSELSFYPVDSSRWKDLETLFEDKGGPKNCWCMIWRSAGEESKHTDGSSRKQYLFERINRNTPVGILAYKDKVPVAWCSVAPRETYRDLGGDTSLEKVWSLVCFYIKREHRRQGLTEQLILEALKYAKKNGAKYMEAYPVDEDSPS
jgi:GNAT superfamily N-acetyltransferase